MKKVLTFCFIASVFVSCSAKEPKVERIVIEAEENAVPGTVSGTWQEPIIDTVRVPGQIDPQGTYYRAPHRTIVEIYPGRVQEVQYPPDERSKGKSDGVE